jgi:hypothetical protein
MLSDRIQAVLRECPHVGKYDLSVMELSNSVVIIRGTVACYFHKQMAQESIRIRFKPLVDKGFTFTLKNEISVNSPHLTEDDE